MCRTPVIPIDPSQSYKKCRYSQKLPNQFQTIAIGSFPRLYYLAHVIFAAAVDGRERDRAKNLPTVSVVVLEILGRRDGASEKYNFNLDCFKRSVTFFLLSPHINYFLFLPFSPSSSVERDWQQTEITAIPQSKLSLSWSAAADTLLPEML